MSYPKSILCVCLGNICRSPSAEAVLRQKCQQANLNITIDSAGTAGYHIGESPDKRAIKIGKTFGYDLSTLSARQISYEDFDRFDLILAMDGQNLKDISKILGDKRMANLLLFDNFTGNSVADPYYGDEQDFIKMFDHIDKVVDNWIAHWTT